MMRCKEIALKSGLLVAMAVPMLMVPAYGQQEVDPTWYDPWAATKTTQPLQAKSAAQKNVKTARKVKSASTEQAKNKKLARAQAPGHSEQRFLLLSAK